MQQRKTPAAMPGFLFGECFDQEPSSSPFRTRLCQGPVFVIPKRQIYPHYRRHHRNQKATFRLFNHETVARRYERRRM
jgi:hypothetical protein